MTKRTIIDIAESLGVSTATVSRALNNAPGVGSERRQQILELAARVNYHPNAIARSLQGQRTNTVAFVPDVRQRPAADLLFKDFITILAERCASNNLDLLIHPASYAASPRETFAKLLQAGRADGVIIADTRQHDDRIRFLVDNNLPFVAFGRSGEADTFPYVDVDGEAGTFAATTHLIERGHRRIAFLGIPLEYVYARYRRDGYVRAMHRNDLPVPASHLIVSLTNERDARAAVKQLLSLPEPPTAFVTAGDMLAIYAMSVASEVGMLAGRDYGLVGFDDLPLAAHTTPTLTTIRQPFDRVCDALIQLLTRVITGTPGERQLLIEPELVIRDTT